MNGILMTPSNHQLIRDGLKTETRQMAGLEQVNEEPDKWRPLKWDGEYGHALNGGFQFIREPLFAGDNNLIVAKPRYHAGEEVYIKEACWYPPEHNQNRSIVAYRLIVAENCGEEAANKNIWRSPLFMPAWAARDFLLMLKVFPQRARDITPAQAVAEGFATPEAWGAEINARNPKARPWDNNLWLFAFQFRLIRKDGVEL